MEERHKALIVEDEFLIADLLRSMVEDLGFTVCGIAANRDDAVTLVTRERPSLVLMDVRLQGEKDGIEVAAAIARIHDVPIIFITASREVETVARVMELSPYPVLFKPVRTEHLADAVRKCMKTTASIVGDRS